MMCARFMTENRLLAKGVALADFLVQGAGDTCPREPSVDLNDLSNHYQSGQRSSGNAIDIFENIKTELLRDIKPFFCEDAPINHLDTTRIIATTSDQKAGWVPQDTQPGDVVALIKGAPFPFILREMDDEHFLVVGDSFIAGIMQGEAILHNDKAWHTLAIG